LTERGEVSLFRTISAEDFYRERTVRLAEDHFERRRPAKNHGWILRNVMPVAYDRYGVVALPWEVRSDGESYVFTGFREGYEFFKKPVPEPLTLTRWHNDFEFLEAERDIPPTLRGLLNQFAASVDVVFVRCSRSADPKDAYYWTIERELFLELSDPFTEMPHHFGHFDIFPRGAPWYLAHRDDEPLLYLAGSARLLDSILAAHPDKALPLGLDDQYF